MEVLKGPQGTLFGRNTTGGSVLLVPQKPTDKWEGYLEGSAGDYGMLRGQGMLNIPLSDTFKVRLDFDREKRNGYMINHSGVGPSAFDSTDYFAGRLSIVANLTPNLENYTIATYSNSFGDGFAGKIDNCLSNGIVPASGSTPAFALSAGASLTAPPACTQIARQNARGDGPWDVEVNLPNPRIKIDIWQVINKTTWQASDTLTIKNIASYSEYKEDDSFSLYSDNFATAAGVPFNYVRLGTNPYGDTASQSTFTEELQFQGRSADSKLTWQAGGYLSNSVPLGGFSTGYSATFLSCSNQIELQCSNPLGAASTQQSETKFWFYSKAVYGQATYKATSKLSLTGGIRYTSDDTKALGESTRITFRPGSAGVNYRYCNDVVHFYTGKPGTPFIVTNPSQCAYYPPEAKSHAPTWLIDVDYKPNDDTLLYAKYARGYRQGGLNLTSIGLEGWNPEKVDDYELGAKLSFKGSDISGYFNIDGFYNKFNNQQIAVNAISDVAGFNGSQPEVNAGKSRIDGLEVDAATTLFDTFKLQVGYTLLDTKLQSINLPTLPAGSPYSVLIPTSVVGGPLALSPKNEFTATATVNLPVPRKVGKLSVGLTYVYTSSQYATRADDTLSWTVAGKSYSVPSASVFGYDPGLLPASNLVNLNVNWDHVMGRPLDLSFFMTNVTNAAIKTSVGNALGSAGFEDTFYAPPRMFGFRAKYSFGQ